MNIREQIKKDINKNLLNQRDVAKQLGITYQQLNMFLNNKRNLNLENLLMLDSVLNYTTGTIAESELKEKIQNTLKVMNEQNNIHRKRLIEKIKESGGFWSYEKPPYQINDDSLIEAALIHLELEDMSYLTKVYSISKIKNVWKERLLPQTDRYNILNFLLAVFVFKIQRPKEYLKKYAASASPL